MRFATWLLTLCTFLVLALVVIRVVPCMMHVHHIYVATWLNLKCRYISILICLGMVRLVRVDGIWDKSHFAHNKYMASLLPRSKFFQLQKLQTPLIDLLDECNYAWSAELETGGGCMDEAIVPHTGVGYLGLRLYIARKPHAGVIKLYVLEENTGGYVVVVYLYTRRRGKVQRLRHVQGSSMPSAWSAFGHDSFHRRPCSWPTASSGAIAWRKTLHGLVVLSSCSPRRTTAMPG